MADTRNGKKIISQCFSFPSLPGQGHAPSLFLSNQLPAGIVPASLFRHFRPQQEVRCQPAAFPGVRRLWGRGSCRGSLPPALTASRLPRFTSPPAVRPSRRSVSGARAPRARRALQGTRGPRARRAVGAAVWVSLEPFQPAFVCAPRPREHSHYAAADRIRLTPRIPSPAFKGRPLRPPSCSFPASARHDLSVS